MKAIYFLSAVFLFLLSCQKKTDQTFLSKDEDRINERVDSVLARMNLEEKIGQLNQVSGSFTTGPKDVSNTSLQDEIKKGRIGSLLNILGAENIRELQKIAVEQSRMKIPIIFALDVIHGYKTTLPVPLAEAASWDIEAIEKSARIAAEEASADGIAWTFAPMVDISRDPRWGRIVEGAGEDTYLGSLIAAARVRGFQGDDLSKNNTILACVKHFAGYGYGEAGRDYNPTIISERVLRETILPPFKAAIDAGSGTIMNAFCDFNGIPCSGSEFLVKQVLKNEWKFKGFVVSDWNSFGEMIAWGIAKNKYEAAEIAMDASSDMDMCAKAYIDELAKLVKDKKISEEQINKAVRRVLYIKFKLGLFDNPYLYCDEKRRKEITLSEANLAHARDIAKKSIVLLKNQNSLLPLSKDIKTIAVIGELAGSKKDLLGSWYALGDEKNNISLIEGIKNKVNKTTKVLFAKGYTIKSDSIQYINEAVNIARQSDVVILAVGEKGDQSGEDRSRANLTFAGSQEKLIEAIKETGKPVVIVLMTGRPIIMNHIDNAFPAILQTWFLGIQAGNAIADVLFGDYNPSGKLPVTFPLTLGQIPIYYAHLNTGRPQLSKNDVYVSRYIDSPNEPLYVFGYGLSYTSFEYSDISLDKKQFKKNEHIKATVTLKNTGKYDGTEIVQMYIHDLVASVPRPVKELKGFQKVFLKAGESKVIEFTITEKDLAFLDKNLKYHAESGDFKIFIGGNSRDTKEAVFSLE